LKQIGFDETLSKRLLEKAAKLREVEKKKEANTR